MGFVAVVSGGSREPIPVVNSATESVRLGWSSTGSDYEASHLLSLGPVDDTWGTFAPTVPTLEPALDFRTFRRFLTDNDVGAWEDLEQSLADSDLTSAELRDRRDVIGRWEEN
ncbi:hypothetical protein JCM31271_26470 [Halorubrum trueperi]